MKRPHSVRRTVLHNPNQNCSSFLVCYFIVRSGKWSETLMMLHEDLQIIIFMIYRDIRFENVEALPIEQAYKLCTS
jgi:hypothetical protein